MLFYVALIACSSTHEGSSGDGDIETDLPSIVDGDSDQSDDDGLDRDEQNYDETPWRLPLLDDPECADDDPCSANTIGNNGECLSGLACKETNRRACVIENREAECRCEVDWIESAEGPCIPDDSQGESLDDPLFLDLSVPIHYGSTRDSKNSFIGSCQGRNGPERIYYFHLAEPLSLALRVTGMDSVAYIRATEDPGQDLYCDDDSGGAYSSRIEGLLDAGEYFLFVDTADLDGGDYKIQVDISCPAAEVFDALTGHCVPDPCEQSECAIEDLKLCSRLLPNNYECVCAPGYYENDSQCVPDENADAEGCSAPGIIEPVSGVVIGSTESAADDGEGSCGGYAQNGKDRVYTIVLNERMYAEILMVGYDTVLHMRTACEDPGSEVACNDKGIGPAARIEQVFEPGFYYLFADSWLEPGPFELTYEFRPDPCAGDPCPGEPECIADREWKGFSCDCGDGKIAYNESCIPDPCMPNPCQESHKSICEARLPDDYVCKCDIGFIESDSGECIPNPDGNKWALLIYLNADNNLEEDGYRDLEEMAEVGSSLDVHVVVQFDSRVRDGGASRRLYIEEDNWQVLEKLGEVDMSQWETLKDFGLWGVSTFPADHYALIIWDHGDGWKRGGNEQQFKGISEDESGEPGKISIANGDYARALSSITTALGRPLDIVGMDACTMAFYEVAFATAPYADVFVASQENEPDEGWAYNSILTTLFTDPEMSPHSLASTIVQTYGEQGPNYPTLSAFDLTRFSELQHAVDAFANEMMNAPEWHPELEAIRTSSQYFANRNFFVDIGDFASRVTENGNLPTELKESARSVRQMLVDTRVANFTQASWANATGLSMYFPSREGWTDAEYIQDGSVWAEQGRWDDFLLFFTNGASR